MRAKQNFSFGHIKFSFGKCILAIYFTRACSTVMSLIVDPGVVILILARSHTCTFMEFDREILSMIILLLPLIQEGLLSVTRESMCTKYWLSA